MTKSTKQLVLTIVTSIISMGIIGYLIWKLGIMDVIIGLVVIGFSFMLTVFVSMKLMPLETQIKIMTEINEYYEMLLCKLQLGQPLPENVEE